MLNKNSYDIKSFGISPKPDFEKLNTADCENALKGYGLKNLKKRRANQILEYIYDQTHPVVKMLVNKNKHAKI